MARSTQEQDAGTQEAEKVVKVTARDAADALPTEGLTGAQEFVQGAITRAAGLIEAKHAIQADLQQSRDFLAFAAKGDDVTEAQAAWVATYLPKRQRGAGDDGSE
jgi:hypothetical protein